MNIYSNILNRFFDYKDQIYQVIGLLENQPGWFDGVQRPVYRECKNQKTGEVICFNYQEMWDVTPRGYSHNGIIEGA